METNEPGRALSVRGTAGRALLLVPVGKPFPGLSLILGIGDGAEAAPTPVTISLL